MEYEVTLLGIPGVCRDREPVRFPYRKAEGIFYYLCVEKAHEPGRTGLPVLGIRGRGLRTVKT